MGLMSSDNIKGEIILTKYVITTLQEEESVMQTFGCCEEVVFSPLFCITCQKLCTLNVL
jgi:hypothetical protein